MPAVEPQCPVTASSKVDGGPGLIGPPASYKDEGQIRRCLGGGERFSIPHCTLEHTPKKNLGAVDITPPFQAYRPVDPQTGRNAAAGELLK